MKTIESIQQLTQEQMLATVCSCETDESYRHFSKFTTSSGIDAQTTLLYTNDALIKYPIYHIRYDKSADEFEFNIDYFDKRDGQIIWVDEKTEAVKWVPTIKNEYGLQYPSDSKLGMKLKVQIPIIMIKNT